MARQTEATREQQPVVRGNTDNYHTRLEAMDYSHSGKLLRTNQQINKQNMFIFSQLPKQVRKDPPDASFQHTHARN